MIMWEKWVILSGAIITGLLAYSGHSFLLSYISGFQLGLFVIMFAVEKIQGLS